MIGRLPAQPIGDGGDGGDGADELHRAVLASFPGYVAVLDARGTVIAANDAWRQRGGTQGSFWISPMSVGDNYLDSCRDAAASGAALGGEIASAISVALGTTDGSACIDYVLPGDGSFLMITRHLAHSSGGAVVAHLDMTGRQRDELALQQARQDLLRTAQLAAAGELVGAITHDLRQPLTALEMELAAAAFLLGMSGEPSQVLADALNGALSQQRRIAESLQVLQDLVARREPKRESVDVLAIIGDVARLVTTEAMARHVRLELDGLRPMLRVWGEATLLHEAILSLVLDGLEAATDPTGADSHVTIETCAVARGWVELLVSYPDYRPTELSQRGWGLAVARSVTEAHLGSIVVETLPTGGASIRLRWPSSEPAAAPLEENP